MKKVRSAYFITSAVKSAQYPPHDLPEIAFIGRSNVGKSSLLNTLVNKPNLAFTSNSPGRTQMINFFNIDDHVCFVDLPGYGYAKVPPAIKEKWQPMIESYLTQRQQLRSVVLLLDSRHTPASQDMMMRQWLLAYHIPMLLVATKIDKIPKTKRPRYIKIITQTLNVHPAESIFPFSALTKEGLQPIWKAILKAAIPTTIVPKEQSPDAILSKT